MNKVSHFDVPIVDWLAANGWPGAEQIVLIGSTDAFDRDYFTWKQGDGDNAIRLRVSQRVVEDHQPRELLRLLDAARVADFIRTNRCVVVKTSSTSAIVFASC
jgi:hypothetical protein